MYHIAKIIYKNQFKKITSVTTERQDKKVSKSSSVSNFELKHKAKELFLNLSGILLMRNVKRLKTSHSVCPFFVFFGVFCLLLNKWPVV